VILDRVDGDRVGLVEKNGEKYCNDGDKDPASFIVLFMLITLWRKISVSPRGMILLWLFKALEFDHQL
jgi:hypothetical protein